MEQILPGMETELCEHLHKIMKKSGIDLRVNSQVKVFTKHEDALRVSIETEGNAVEEQFSKILVTVGRRPSHTAFENLELQVDKKGYLIVNESLQTSKKNIYAIGDIVGPPLLAHKATKQGVIVAEMISGLKEKYEDRVVPSCVFTIPPLASVVFTEKADIEEGHNVGIGRFPYRASGKAVSMGQTEGIVKIVGDDNGKLLGVHILGAESANLIGEAILTIDKGMKVADIAESIHPHPTLTELMQEAAENFYKKAIHTANK
jgi:dihydrolipoamide dehydrogenase